MLKRRELIILEVINKQAGEAYGVSVMAGYEERTGIDLSYFHAYHTLKSLKFQGLVTSRKGKTLYMARGNRAKTYYTITDKGRAELPEHPKA